MAKFEPAKRIKKALDTRIARDQHFQGPGQRINALYFTVSVSNIEFNSNPMKWQIEILRMRLWIVPVYLRNAQLFQI
jgi:hypothetical protein